MKKRILETGVALAILALANSASASIMSEAERAEKMGAARKLLNRQVVSVEELLLAVAPSPFRPDLGAESSVEVPEAAEAIIMSDEERLAALLPGIKPTGTFTFGGEDYLIFNETRYKTGAEIPVMYENFEYKVVVTEITGASYTIRYGESELQQKLK